MNPMRRQLMRPSATATPLAVAAAPSRSGTVFIARTPETFTYDADGYMISDGRFHYFWNGENRLVCASNSEYVVTYAYDHRVLDTIIRLQRRIETARYYLGRSPYSVSYLKTKPLGGE